MFMAVWVPFETKDVGSRGGLYRLDVARPQSSAGLSTKDKQVIHYGIEGSHKKQSQILWHYLNHNETKI